jgi:hypothetical protein
MSHIAELMNTEDFRDGSARVSRRFACDGARSWRAAPWS